MDGHQLRGPGLLAALLLLVCPAGCLDVRDFEGVWSGPIIADETLRQGFPDSTRVVALELADVDLNGTSATLTTSDGRFLGTPLARTVKYSSDTLASLTFDGQPLRTFLHFAPLASERGGCPAIMLISLYSGSFVELRIIRGNELYGVFRLEKSGPALPLSQDSRR